MPTQPYTVAALLVLLMTQAGSATAAPDRQEPHPLRELTLAGGNMPAPVAYWSGQLLAIPNTNGSLLGLYYRQEIDRTLSIRLGLEDGEVLATTLAPPSDADPSIPQVLRLKRLHLSLLSNGWIYGGAGLTYIEAVPANFAYRQSNSISAQALVGLRYAYEPLTVGVEYRLGVAGPNGLVFMGGFQF